MAKQGRILGIGPTDNTSDQRTPRQPLRLIPGIARASFVPVVPARYATNPHEWDIPACSWTTTTLGWGGC